MSFKNEWFEVDAGGLANVLERRGVAWLIFELVANAFDASAKQVDVTVSPVDGRPFVNIKCQDDGNGFDDMAAAWKLFGASASANDPLRRGRFSLGEKLCVAACRSSCIQSTTGTVEFLATGNRRFRPSATVPVGSTFYGELRATRDEALDMVNACTAIVPPSGSRLFVNGVQIARPALLRQFEATLPTVAVGDRGELKRSRRKATVEAFPADGFGGGILEMGLPVCDAAFPWRLNVLQKMPLGFDRDAAPAAFVNELTVAAVNAMADTLGGDDVNEGWAVEAIASPAIRPEALAHVVKQRFGDRAVVATPGDPLANANAEAAGCVVVHGGALPAGAWANIRKHGTLHASGQVFPTRIPTPANAGQEAQRVACAACGRPF